MILKDRFDRLPASVQEWIKHKYAREGKHQFHPADIVSINPSDLKRHAETNELSHEMSRKWKAVEEVSVIVDAQGNAIMRNTDA